jgi:hypothetical protein
MPAPIPTGWTQQELTDFFNGLAAQAEAAKTQFISTRTPDYLQPNLADFIAAYKPPVGTNQIVITDGDSVVVHNAADANQAGSPGVAHVVAGVLTKVNLTV